VITLRVENGASLQQRYALTGAITSIGRAASNDLVFADSHLSSEHGQLIIEGGQAVYRDLQSTNGSAVQRAGQLIVMGPHNQWEITLLPNDILVLGDARNPVRISVQATAALAALAAVDDVDDDDDDVSLSNRLIASRSIVDLPAVSQSDPARAVAVYQVVQRLQARLEPAAVLEACTEAVFELLPRATNVAILLRADDNKDRFLLAVSKVRSGAGERPRRIVVIRIDHGRQNFVDASGAVVARRRDYWVAPSRQSPQRRYFF
jgi:FHA domain